MLRAIAAAGSGEAIFGPTIAERVLAFLTRPLSAYDQQLFPELTAAYLCADPYIPNGGSDANSALSLTLQVRPAESALEVVSP